MRRLVVFLLVFLLLFAFPALPQTVYDIVFASGRVIDPETGLDAVRHVGISGDRISAISEQPLQGTIVIDAAGLVVSPGFIDLHAHGQTNQANQYQARDGVTTALELESGRPFVRAWIESRRDQALLNYGATAGHGPLRREAFLQFADQWRRIRAAQERGETLEPTPDAAEFWRKSTHQPLARENLPALLGALEQGLREGALGVGMAHGYFPGATREEIYRVFEFASTFEVPVFTHVRNMGAEYMQEVIADAAATGASLHIVHANSMSLADLPLVLEMVEGARRRRLDVSTETYPYTAASTNIASAIFDPGWRERLGMDYSDIQHQDTGERLTADSFDKYRSSGATVIMHMMKEEWIELAVKTPFVMIASDGMPYAPGAHPRSAGTFSRVLGRYVRERALLSLPEAIAKMTLLPARRLESVAPQMKRKGRLQVGADADITVFDPKTVSDTATFEDDLSFSKGIQHVLVNGVFVVRDAESAAGALPGRAILGRLAVD